MLIQHPVEYVRFQTVDKAVFDGQVAVVGDTASQNGPMRENLTLTLAGHDPVLFRGYLHRSRTHHIPVAAGVAGFDDDVSFTVVADLQGCDQSFQHRFRQQVEWRVGSEKITDFQQFNFHGAILEKIWCDFLY